MDEEEAAAQSGAARPAFEEVDLSDVIEGEVLQFESVAFERGVRLESQVEPGIELRGNESELQEVATDSLSIGLTFDSVSLGTGRHKVKGIAAAIGLPSDVTLVEEDIEVEIQITEDGSGGADSGSSGWTGENGEDGE